jgi:hypothetical protein
MTLCTKATIGPTRSYIRNIQYVKCNFSNSIHDVKTAAITIYLFFSAVCHALSNVTFSLFFKCVLFHQHFYTYRRVAMFKRERKVNRLSGKWEHSQVLIIAHVPFFYN